MCEYESIIPSCRGCKNDEEHRPNPFWLDCSPGWRDSKDPYKYRLLQKCKALFLNHENIIAMGADSFVLETSIEDIKYAVKIYNHLSLKKVLQYKEDMEEFARRFNDKVLQVGDKDYTIFVNPILYVQQLKGGCIATVSRYIDGLNEEDRCRSECRKPEINDLIFFERPVQEFIGIPLHPMNFKVDMDNEIITITDIKNCIAKWWKIFILKIK